MRLLLKREDQHWTFEFEFVSSSHKTSAASCSCRTSLQELPSSSTPSATTHLGRSVSRSTQCLPAVGEPRQKYTPVKQRCRKPSLIQSILDKTVRRNRFRERQSNMQPRSNCPQVQELPVSSDPAELEGTMNASAWELDASAHGRFREGIPNLVQYQNPRQHFRQRANGILVNEALPTEYGRCSSSPLHPAPLRINMVSSSRLPTDSTDYNPPASRSTEVSPIERTRHIETAHLMSNVVSFAQPYCTPSTSTTQTPDVSPISPGSDARKHGPDKHSIYHDNNNNDRGTRQSSSPTGITSLFHNAVNHTKQQQCLGYDMNNQLLSPTSTRRSSITRGSEDAGPFSPSNHLVHITSGDWSPPTTHFPTTTRGGLIVPSTNSIDEDQVTTWPLETWSNHHNTLPNGGLVPQHDSFAEFPEQINLYDAPPPMYSLVVAALAPPSMQEPFIDEHALSHLGPSEPIGKRRSSRNKRGSLRSQLSPLPCAFCTEEFTGEYAKGNRSRHVRLKHPARAAGIPHELACRECGALYNRADARRKHEWKKHRIPGTKPTKRRKEGKKIFMPEVEDFEDIDLLDIEFD